MTIRRLFISVFIFSLSVLPACKQKKDNPVSDYVGALKSGYTRSQDTAQKANLTGVRQAVETYRAASGEYPKDLKDIENLAGFPIDQSQYDYDPQSGTVTLKAGK